MLKLFEGEWVGLPTKEDWIAYHAKIGYTYSQSPGAPKAYPCLVKTLYTYSDCKHVFAYPSDMNKLQNMPPEPANGEDTIPQTPTSKSSGKHKLNI